MRVRIGPGVALFEWLWCALHDAKVKDLAVAHQDYGGLVKADWRKINYTHWHFAEDAQRSLPITSGCQL